MALIPRKLPPSFFKGGLPSNHSQTLPANSSNLDNYRILPREDGIRKPCLFSRLCLRTGNGRQGYRRSNHHVTSLFLFLFSRTHVLSQPYPNFPPEGRPVLFSLMQPF